MILGRWTMNKYILIVEDEQNLAEIMSDFLIKSGFETEIILNGNDVIPCVEERMPALILLDLMLPGKDGLDICKEIRSFSNVPILITTAKVEEIDRLLGLELGADDYICKPYSPREVVARVKAVLRRIETKDVEQLKDLALDREKYRVVLCGHSLELTTVEFHILELLSSRPGQIYSRSQLMDHIYNDDRIVSDRTIDSHIKKLRKKMRDAVSDTEYIHSVYGVGYKFEVEI